MPRSHESRLLRPLSSSLWSGATEWLEKDEFGWKMEWCIFLLRTRHTAKCELYYDTILILSLSLGCCCCYDFWLNYMYFVIICLFHNLQCGPPSNSTRRAVRIYPFRVWLRLNSKHNTKPVDTAKTSEMNEWLCWWWRAPKRCADLSSATWHDNFSVDDDFSLESDGIWFLIFGLMPLLLAAALFIISHCTCAR